MSTETTRSGARSVAPPGTTPDLPSVSMEQADFVRVVVALLRGVLYEDDNEAGWLLLHRYRGRVVDHMADMGLVLVIDEAERYAYVKAANLDDVDVPRLVPRHRLSFRVSLLLALLRKRLAEADASSADPRLILSRDQIIDLLQVHLPRSDNAVRVVAEVDAVVSKIVDLGFLRRVSGQADTYEVRRIIKAYIDAQWLADFDTQLQEYLTSLGAADE